MRSRGKVKWNSPISSKLSTPIADRARPAAAQSTTAVANAPKKNAKPARKAVPAAKNLASADSLPQSNNFMNNELATTTNGNSSPALLAPSNFEMAQRMATALSKSSLIPKEFQDNLPNCLIALEMSQRMGASPMMVMQNLYIVHGKPAWSSQFVIAAINSTGRFSPLRFQMEGEGDKRVCTAWAVDLAANERLEGPPVSIDMAKKEGWYNKNGSKWQTMPELMLRYRAATFFGRLYAPEVLMGMREEGEIIDVEATQVSQIERPQIPTAREVNAGGPTPRAKKKPAAKSEPDPQSVVAQIEARLTDAGYKPEELVRVAVTNNWADTTTKTLAEIGDDKLKFFLEDWQNVEHELASLKSA